MLIDIAKIVGETRYMLGLSATDGASLEAFDVIDDSIGITSLPSRLIRKVPSQNYSDLQNLVKISWL